jgi:hypothetical protein
MPSLPGPGRSGGNRSLLAVDSPGDAPNQETDPNPTEHNILMSSMPDQEQFQFDHSSLVREEVFTDLRTGQIRRLTPVDAEGRDDTSKPVRYIGQTQVMTNAGALPLSFELDVDGLEAACEAFAGEARKALEETMEELKRMQREAQSSIMVPGQEGRQGGFGGPGGGMPGGGLKL